MGVRFSISNQVFGVELGTAHPESVFLHSSRQHMSLRHLSISGISQMLLTQFGPNFKGKSLTDANRQGDICTGNICPGNIC